MEKNGEKKRKKKKKRKKNIKKTKKRRKRHFDVGAREVILGHDVVFERDVGSKSHAVGVDVEDAPFGSLVGQRKLDLTVDSARSDEGGVERFDAVGGHDDLDVSLRVEAVELIEQFEHGSLDFPLASRVRLVSLGAYRVDLVDEDNRRRVLLRHPEQLSNQFGSVAKVLLDQLRANHPQKGGRRLVGHRLGQQRFAGARSAVQDDSLGWFDAHFLVVLGVGEW